MAQAPVCMGDRPGIAFLCWTAHCPSSEIRETGVGLLGMAPWNLRRSGGGLPGPMAPVNALVAACLGTPCTTRRPCPSAPASIMTRPDTSRRFTAQAVRLLIKVSP